MFFRVLFVFVILSHDRRRPVHVAVTEYPTAEWVAHQLLEAFPWDSAPHYLLRDRDGSYGEKFHEAASWLGIREVLTAPQSPWQKAYASHCTSFEHCGRTEAAGWRRQNLTRCAFRGMLTPTDSYRLSGLSV